jgi:hypothetical protein
MSATSVKTATDQRPTPSFPSLMSLPHSARTFWRGTTIYSPDFNPIEESISNRGIYFKDQGAVMSGEGAGPPEALECAGKSYPKFSKRGKDKYET